VCDEPSRPAGDDHRRDYPTGGCRWQCDRLTELIDERIGRVVDRVGDHEGRVAQRARQPLAHASRMRGIPEVDDGAREQTLRPASGDEIDGQVRWRRSP
jgi:hypothetical protein